MVIVPKDGLDIFTLDGELPAQALKDGQLKPELAKKGFNFHVLLTLRLIICIGIYKTLWSVA
jgi:hypothetical protein